MREPHQRESAEVVLPDDTPEVLCRDGAMSVREAENFCGLRKSKLYELMDGGVLPYSKVGAARRIPKVVLIRLLALNLKGGPANWRQRAASA